MVEKTNEKRGFSALDVFIVFGIILIVFGMIGQSVAVHFAERYQKSEIFEVSFVVRSYDKGEAQMLLTAQGKDDKGLLCKYGDLTVGYLQMLGSVALPSPDGEGTHSTLCDLTGIADLYGRSNGEDSIIYGCGHLEKGDVLLLSIDQKALALEITAVNVKKN